MKWKCFTFKISQEPETLRYTVHCGILISVQTSTFVISVRVVWIPAWNNCYLPVQVFLCSLFAPVCLDRPVWPCRSLCEAVKAGCVDRMLKYGFPWPEMLRCDQFPSDNDLCIGLRGVDAHGQCSRVIITRGGSSPKILGGIAPLSSLHHWVHFLRSPKPKKYELPRRVENLHFGTFLDLRNHVRTVS